MGAEVLEEAQMEPFVTEVEAFASGEDRSVRFLRLGRWPVDERLEDRMKAAGAAVVMVRALSVLRLRMTKFLRIARHLEKSLRH